MGTKNNPGQFDCYASAEPDEPMFVLLGRDRHAAGLVKLWGLLRALEGEDEAVTAEAFDCADLMDAWRAGLNKQQTRVFDKIFMALTEGMDEHPDGFIDACDCNLCRSY